MAFPSDRFGMLLTQDSKLIVVLLAETHTVLHVHEVEEKTESLRSAAWHTGPRTRA